MDFGFVSSSPLSPDWGGYQYPDQVPTTPSAPTVTGNNTDWWARITNLGLGTLNTVLGFKLQNNAINKNAPTQGPIFGLSTGGGVGTGNIGGIWLWLVVIGILVLIFKR